MSADLLWDNRKTEPSKTGVLKKSRFHRMSKKVSFSRVEYFSHDLKLSERCWGIYYEEITVLRFRR